MWEEQLLDPTSNYTGYPEALYKYIIISFKVFAVLPSIEINADFGTVFSIHFLQWKFYLKTFSYLLCFISFWFLPLSFSRNVLLRQAWSWTKNWVLKLLWLKTTAYFCGFKHASKILCAVCFIGINSIWLICFLPNSV